jgi:hypothetical protein
LWSPAAENLVVGTALHESSGLRHLDQVTGPDDATLGPAIGLFQIEPATHADLQANFLAYRPALADRLARLLAAEPEREAQLATNLCYATAVCRLIYLRAPEPLPKADDVEGLARYWKRFYNTRRGRGAEAQFILHYRAQGD